MGGFGTWVYSMSFQMRHLHLAQLCRSLPIVLALVAFLLAPSWIARADREAFPHTFEFDENKATILQSYVQYKGDCNIEINWLEPTKCELEIRFLRLGEEVLTIVGHSRSVFLTEGDSLFFAEFSPKDCGCSVSAYDMRDGRRTWSTLLSAVGRVKHFAYSNSVTLSINAGKLWVTGHESGGDYMEILDMRTGRVLGHKIYRKGFRDNGGR